MRPFQSGFTGLELILESKITSGLSTSLPMLLRHVGGTMRPTPETMQAWMLGSHTLQLSELWANRHTNSL